jgi:nicotinate-nucleotide adenylyltransferase
VRVGILGGTFNPPHIGHLVCAQEALLQLELEHVMWIPVGEAPHRELETDPGAEARLEMAERAVDGDQRFSVSRMELDRSGPSYTSDTLRALRDSSPDDELFLILGGDQAAALPSWHEPEEVLSLATITVVERVTWTRNAIAIKIARLKGSERVRYLDMPLIQVSSTMIRRRAAKGQPIRYLVPDGVGEYIESKGLYRAASPAPAAKAEAPAASAGDAAKPAEAADSSEAANASAAPNPSTAPNPSAAPNTSGSSGTEEQKASA